MFDAIGGSLVSGLFSAREANKNRDFQAYMSGSARQRDVADLKKAGLNPILAAGYGGGSSTPGGAQGSMPDIGSTVNTARSVSQAGQLLKAQIEATRAQAGKTKAETSIINKNVPVADLIGDIAAKVTSSARKFTSSMR